MTSETRVERVEELRRAGLAEQRAGNLERALELYDQALPLASEEEVRELITINKADVLISMERSGAEVQALPTILMRRRNPHHAFLAAYALTYKHRIAGEAKRAVFYGELALEVATAASRPFWKIGALNELGMSYDVDSQFERAIHCYQSALDLVNAVQEADDQTFGHVAIVQNLAYSKLVVGSIDEGLTLIHGVLDQIANTAARAESYIDLCYGYLERGEQGPARFFGEAALQLTTDPRQIRNAHYLLGEVAYKAGDTDAAEFHFEKLANFYPEFRNLKSLLFALDLRSMVNFKL